MGYLGVYNTIGILVKRLFANHRERRSRFMTIIYTNRESLDNNLNYLFKNFEDLQPINRWVIM